MTRAIFLCFVGLSATTVSCAVSEEEREEEREEGREECNVEAGEGGRVADVPGPAIPTGTDGFHVPLRDGFAFWGERLLSESDEPRPMVVALSSWVSPSQDLADWEEDYLEIALGSDGCEARPASFLVVGHNGDGPSIDFFNSQGLQTEGKVFCWGDRSWQYQSSSIHISFQDEMDLESIDEPEVGDMVSGIITLTNSGVEVVRTIDFTVPFTDSQLWSMREL